MPYCNNCGGGIEEEDYFCSKCGTPSEGRSLSFPSPHSSPAPLSGYKGKAKRKLLLGGIVVLAVAAVVAGIVYLQPSSTLSTAIVTVPEDYTNIQEAIDASSDGDVIEVVPGTYQENIDFKGKNITPAQH